MVTKDPLKTIQAALEKDAIGGRHNPEIGRALVLAVGVLEDIHADDGTEEYGGPAGEVIHRIAIILEPLVEGESHD